MTDPVAAPPRGTTTKVVATIVVLVAFAGGLIVGAICDRIWMMRHPGPSRMAMHAITERVLGRLDKELSLSPQQHDEVKKILDAHAQRIRQISESMRPQIRQEIDRNNADIERVLTPEQRAKFDKLKMQFVPRHIRHF